MRKYTFLNNNGEIRKSKSPAIYFDTSVLIDYWMVEGSEIDLPHEDLYKERPHVLKLQEIIRENPRLIEMQKLRKQIIFEEVEALPIYTPLCMIELSSWHAELMFKQMAGDAVGYKAIQKESLKNIGDYLSKIHEQYLQEIDNPCLQEKRGTPPATILYNNINLNWSYAECHALQGFVLLPLNNFKITLNDFYGGRSFCISASRNGRYHAHFGGAFIAMRLFREF